MRALRPYLLLNGNIPGIAGTRSFIREDDAAARIDFLVDCVWVVPCTRKTSRARPEVSILYLLHVIPRFAKRRDPVCLGYSPLTRIVRRQGQIQVAIVSF